MDHSIKSYNKLSRSTNFTDDAHANWDILSLQDWKIRKFEAPAKKMYELLMQFDYFMALKIGDGL